MVELFDARTKNGDLEQAPPVKRFPDNPRKNADRLNKAVTKMFRKFPPGSKKTN